MATTRPGGRRLSDGLWMTVAGGGISKTNGALDTMAIDIPFDALKIKSGGYAPR